MYREGKNFNTLIGKNGYFIVNSDEHSKLGKKEIKLNSINYCILDIVTIKL